MDKLRFKEEDKTKIIDFLNLVATHAEFKFKTQDVIKYFKLLNYMQVELLPKVDANILEIKRVIDSPEEKKE